MAQTTWEGFETRHALVIIEIPTLVGLLAGLALFTSNPLWPALGAIAGACLGFAVAYLRLKEENERLTAETEELRGKVKNLYGIIRRSNIGWGEGM